MLYPVEKIVPPKQPHLPVFRSIKIQDVRDNSDFCSKNEHTCRFDLKYLCTASVKYGMDVFWVIESPVYKYITFLWKNIKLLEILDRGVAKRVLLEEREHSFYQVVGTSCSYIHIIYNPYVTANNRNEATSRNKRPLLILASRII